MHRRWLWIALPVLGLLPLASGSAVAADQALLAQARALFKPLPKEMSSPDNPITSEKVALGRLLYFDTRVSVDGTVSCARCHQPFLHGTDALPKAIGAEGRENPRNAPTVLNAALQFVEHWRGDRTSVEDQATQALIGPPSFGNPSYESAMAKLKGIPGYSGLFAKAFPEEKEPVTPQNWGKAIGAYERTLVTPSPFDAYLAGDEQALSPDAEAGLREFVQTGCATCHNGVNVGGGLFQKFGLLEDYWKATGSTQLDKGRVDVTHNPGDTYAFKVPSLRNVAMTPPYFHDGSVATLPKAVRVMARLQLGKTLSDTQVSRIVAFLRTLTGKLPSNFAEVPVLPASGFRPTGERK
ncbi:MAG TPA: cytochrome c peroxidase [Candidatus Methylomirabilis sp.]|nr:cytochrome c peroxidase [Candidatus Methylomirabilis sp.]